MPHLEFSTLTLLLAQIGAILLLSRLLGLVTRWLGQPMVIAEILAGVVLGPSVLTFATTPALRWNVRTLTLDVRPLGFVSEDHTTDICRTAHAKQASLILLGSHKPLLLEGQLGGTVAGSGFDLP